VSIADRKIVGDGTCSVTTADYERFLRASIDVKELRKDVDLLRDDIRAVPELVKQALLDVFTEAAYTNYGGLNQGELPVLKDGLDVGFTVNINKLVDNLEVCLHNNATLSNFDTVDALRNRISELESEIGRSVEVAKQLQKD